MKSIVKTMMWTNEMIEIVNAYKVKSSCTTFTEALRRLLIEFSKSRKLLDKSQE